MQLGAGSWVRLALLLLLPHCSEGEIWGSWYVDKGCPPRYGQRSKDTSDWKIEFDFFVGSIRPDTGVSGTMYRNDCVTQPTRLKPGECGFFTGEYDYVGCFIIDD
ncbi:unnamed protein product [Sympodiomycopsis kandeliae]